MKESKRGKRKWTARRVLHEVLHCRDHSLCPSLLQPDRTDPEPDRLLHRCGPAGEEEREDLPVYLARAHSHQLHIKLHPWSGWNADGRSLTMKVLVANLGSTSFKYRLFDMNGETLLARGSVERIGSPTSRCAAQAGDRKIESEIAAPDHAAAVRLCLKQLVGLSALKSAKELSAIGFKAVHADGVSGVQRVDEKFLRAMESFADVAPAHNPPYTTAMRLLARELPEIPLVAAFETGFHQTIAPEHKHYAAPVEWYEQYGIRRWGFHGASHRYVAERTAQLQDNPKAKIISCHLGGSSSLCAIENGKSVANSLGMSPQTGLPHNNRVGDFDPFALPVLLRRTGKTLEQLLDDLANRSGLLGLSGFNDLRDIEINA